MAYAEVTEGSDGLFYVTPLRVGLNGTFFASKGEAEYVARAVNHAYEVGKEELREGLRDLLGVSAAAQEYT